MASVSAAEVLTDDDEAVARTLAGDLEAFATLVARYGAVARRTALLLGAGDDADDAVQEGFAKAFRHLGSFRGGSFQAWLLRIVANEVRNLHRGNSRRARREERVLSGVAAGVEAGPEEAVLAAAARSGVIDAVRTLPENDRIVVLCRYFLDMSELETAEVLGVPRGTVKSRLSRALAKLRPVLEEEKVGRRVPRVVPVIVAMALAVGAGAAVSPQVRAAISDVLRFAGIEVHRSSGPVPSGVPTTMPALPGEHVVDLATARSLAAFPIQVPASLGAPEKVTVSDGTPPRVVSMTFAGGSLRLDEFDGGLAPLFAKYAYVGGGQEVAVGSASGVWVAGPQEVVYVDRAGEEVRATAHLAADTLVWQVGGVTLRLEGTFTEQQAVAIAAK